MITLSASTLPIGDLPALQHLQLEAVGVVQGVSVGTISVIEKYRTRRPSLNRGPGFRPGTPEAYFGFLWDNPSEISLFMPVSNAYNNWAEYCDRLRNAPFDSPLAVRRLGLQQRLYQTFVSYPGLVFETGEITNAFAHHFDAAHQLLRDNAKALGADGVIGVVDEVQPLRNYGATQFRLVGTAVRRIEGGAANATPWTTYLNAQPLVKLLESGRMPIELTSSYLNLVALHTPVSAWLRTGSAVGTREITEFQRFRELGYDLVRSRLHSAIAGDELHGVVLETSRREAGGLVAVSETRMRGTRVRRFRTDSVSLPATLTLGLS